jgi:hypothetical protein
MQRRATLAFGACIAALATFAARAADAPPTPAGAPPTAAAVSPESAASAPATAEKEPRGGEPYVKRTVIDDGQTHIEELRVRGNLEKVTVKPKNAPKYEVLTGEGLHQTVDDPAISRGSAGKRVWNVLRF